MVLALKTRKTGYDFCHQYDGWTQHPFTVVDEMRFAIADREVMLELVGGTFGPRTLTEAWSIRRLVALRENYEQYCRRLVAIEVSAGNGPIIDNGLRALRNDITTVIGTFAHICTAKLEIDDDVPMRVDWQMVEPPHEPRPSVIVLCHQNHRDERPVTRRHAYFDNTILALGKRPAIGCRGNFLEGFPQWWHAVQQSR